VNRLDWLLDSDPAIRWQAMRDLTDAPPEKIAAERARVPREGIGAEILACQGADGSWHRTGARDWLPTLFTLQLLRATGVDPADPAVESAIARLEKGFRWAEEFGAKPFFEGEVEPCINGGALALGSYFGRPSESLALRLVGEQLADGGWNCYAPKSVRSSYHTTICVLEGLLEYERARGAAPHTVFQTVSKAVAKSVSTIAAARRRAEEYLLARGLFRRLSTGEVANPEFLKFAYPPRYHYDILRALDYFRTAAAQAAVRAAVRTNVQAAVQSDEHARPQQNVQPDPRMDVRFADALQIVESRRQPDSRWLLDQSYADSLALPFTESVGEPSRWNTLRALRVLRWAGRD
jgi:hypothetical protein